MMNARAVICMTSVFNAAKCPSQAFSLLDTRVCPETDSYRNEFSKQTDCIRTRWGYLMRLVQRLFFIPSFCLLASIFSFAQTDRGTITGTVADPTNAVIPGANVTATNTQTTAKYETVSTETGNYTLTQLPAGTYELTVELPGFKK